MIKFTFLNQYFFLNNPKALTSHQRVQSSECSSRRGRGGWWCPGEGGGQGGGGKVEAGGGHLVSLRSGRGQQEDTGAVSSGQLRHTSHSVLWPSPTHTPRH